MPSVAVRFLRVALASSTLLLAYLASPLSHLLPIVTTAAADDGSLGGSAAVLANNFVFGIALILTFIFGFAIRDAIQKHAMRAKVKARPASVPKRA